MYMKKAIGIIIPLICLVLSFLPTVSAQETAPGVIEVDIRILSSDYRALTSSREKAPYTVTVSAAGAEADIATINIRGNSSRDFGLASPTKRIPFELKFSEVGSFGGIENKSVKFINSFYPYRLIAEYLALDLFDYAGIPTPAHSLAFIRFNDVDFGLYIAVEDINKTFLKKRYAEPLNSAYKSTIDEEKREEFIDSKWFGHLFEKVSGDTEIDRLQELISALDRGEGYEELINIDEWLRYFACVAVTGADGSILTEQNNFALYDNDGRYDLIPWDLSEAFSGRRMPDSIDRYFSRRKEEDPTPLFDLLMRNQSYKEQYHAYIREFTEGFLSPKAITARYDAILDAISPYLPRDHSILLNYDNALSDLRSDSAETYSNLRYMLGEYYDNIKAQLDEKTGSFPVNPMFADYYDGSFEEIIAVAGSYSHMLDTKLPGRIARKGVSLSGPATVRNYVWLLLLASAALICFTVRLIAAKRKTRKTDLPTEVSSPWLRLKQSLARHRVMLCIFLFILVYECLFAWQFGDWKTGEYAYAYHALDYSFGFCSRLLPGAITSFLFGEASPSRVTALETVLLLSVFAALSYLLEKLYYRLDANDRTFAILLIFFFITGPCSFGIYVKELGMLDAWWLYCAVAVFFLLSKKKLRPLIPVFAFLLPMIYYSSVLCFAPFIVIILLYEATLEDESKDRRRLFALACVFAVVSVGLTAYFVAFRRNGIKMTPDEFFSLLKIRGCSGDLDEIYRVMFNVPPVESGIDNGTEADILNQLGVHSLLTAQIVIRLRQHLTIFLESTKTRYIVLAYAFVLVSPVLALLLSCFRYKLKTGKNRMQKFVFFCMAALFFFINLSCLFVSTDNVKWLAHAFTLTFACLLFVIYREPRMLGEKIIPALRRIPLPVLICYCVIYAAAVFHPYT